MSVLRVAHSESRGARMAMSFQHEGAKSCLKSQYIASPTDGTISHPKCSEPTTYEKGWYSGFGLPRRSGVSRAERPASRSQKVVEALLAGDAVRVLPGRVLRAR